MIFVPYVTWNVSKSVRSHLRPSAMAPRIKPETNIPPCFHKEISARIHYQRMRWACLSVCLSVCPSVWNHSISQYIAHHKNHMHVQTSRIFIMRTLTSRSNGSLFAEFLYTACDCCVWIACQQARTPKSLIQLNQSTSNWMWANAQPDGRPAKHRWRPLFNAAKFGWRPLLDAVQ